MLEVDSKTQLVRRGLRAVFVYLAQVVIGSIGMVGGSFALALSVNRVLGDGDVWPLTVSILREPFFFLPNVAGLCCGFLINRRLQSRSTARVWVLPCIWLAYNITDWLTYARYARHPGWRDIWDNFFGAGCAGSECSYELMVTAPFYISVAYSLGAWLALSKSKRSREKQTESASGL